MASDLCQIPLSPPSSRPRAATEMMMSSNELTSPLPSRRSSQVMNPPTMLLGQGHDEKSRITSNHARERATSGPLRHPKPFTPADIHSMLECEQEAIVNRLSRELSLLRQQTASVASTTSSTSATFNDALDALHGSSFVPGPIYPTVSRRHRSSSSLSSSYFPVIQGSRTSSVSGITPSRETWRAQDSSRASRSREPSFTSHQKSERLFSTPPPQLQKQIDPSATLTYSPRLCPHCSSLSQQRRASGSGAPRPDEGLSQRGEIEAIKRENEMMRGRQTMTVES
ncbi:hypothetical protein P175DRAFT_0561217 [Aspergillus ochraceoroseus IBT 24754]|uniref:Uncharacterized protein n=2 Tax=Aspergillus ochraceoroseus TaxID=138278 RepID=A0A2T5LLL1_9EURO|nr:uncharacterized protein P175DRAFT_0561217 [Aspergillus ochraceoroseus IBT 24754]KKK12384.1 hypothetical protein AOCH_001895 [Aspergillus ochraceoroseus]PTU17167.1 hypothetical protein P175DRAFT_0561217 [Aspergillus ochraceoroseus IBT 24754]